MTKTLAMGRMAAVMVGTLAMAGCAGGNLGALGDILGGAMGGGGAQQGQILVEIQGVDTRQQVIGVVTEDGRRGNLVFDSNTTVVYRQQQYPVTALERGDVAAIRVQETQQGALYASHVEVRQSVQERSGQAAPGTGTTSTGTALYQEASGTVGTVDTQRGWFELRTTQGTYAATLPANPPAELVRSFNALRTGQNVRIEGVFLGNGRVELARIF